MSVSTHLGCEQSRRDDLESILYLMIYFAKGHLPWQGIKAETRKDKYNKILKVKKRSGLDSLFTDLPGNFSNINR